VLNQTNAVAGTRVAFIPDIQGSVIASTQSFGSGDFPFCVPRKKVRDCGPVHRIKGAGTAELNGDIGWKRRCEDSAA
jgi:hypothetical protein